MSDRLRVATRRSPLARSQAELVARALARAHRELSVRLCPMATSGDRVLRPGTAPDFTDALDRALLDGTVDVAVHSAKDLPVAPVPGLTVAACPRRADPRDCLVVAGSVAVGELPKGARVGSSSLRRQAQLLRWRPDLQVVELRGNVDRRVARVRSGELDAVILAVAGLVRLGRSDEIRRRLPTAEFLPAPAQGALAVVVRANDRKTLALAREIDDPPTHAAVVAEQAFAALLGGDCRVPLGALARLHRGRLRLEGEVLSPDGRVRLRGSAVGRLADARGVGRRLARGLLARGAGLLLAPRGR